MHLKTVILAGLAAAAGLGGAPSEGAALRFDLQAVYWLAQPSGDAAVGGEGQAGTEFDLEDDFGYRDREGIPGIRASVGRKHRLLGELLQLDASADNAVDRNIRFEDLLFRVNTEVSSSVEATLARLAYQFTMEFDSAMLGLLLGGQYVDLEARAEAANVGRASASVQAGLPFFGAALELNPHPNWEFAAAGMGSSWEIDDVDATFLDLQASVAFRWEPLYLAAGYRHLIIDAEDADEFIRADLTFSGPIVFGGLSW